MAYNPNLHTLSNKPYAVSQGTPDGARTYMYDPAVPAYRPFISTAEVLSEITGIDRKGHALFVVNTGGTLSNGVVTGGTNDFYYFKNAYGDGNLVLLVPPAEASTQVPADWNAVSPSVARILNKPTIPADQVPADWNASSGVTRILNKPTIPTVPDNVNGTTGVVAKFTAAKEVGNSQISDTGNQISINTTFNPARLSVANTETANVAAGYFAQSQPLNNTGDLLAIFTELKLTGNSFSQTVDTIDAAGFFALYMQQIGSVTILGKQKAAMVAVLGLSMSSSGALSGIISSIVSAINLTDNGIYGDVRGVTVTSPGTKSYQGRPLFTGVITKYTGIVIEASDFTIAATEKHGIRQEGQNDKNYFAAFTFFGPTEASPTSSVHIKGPAYSQLRLETAGTPSSSSDTNGQVGDICFDDNYGYRKCTSGWKRWALTAW